MKLIVLMIFFSFSVVYAEPENNVDNSPKLCLETIYKKEFWCSTIERERHCNFAVSFPHAEITLYLS